MSLGHDLPRTPGVSTSAVSTSAVSTSVVSTSRLASASERPSEEVAPAASPHRAPPVLPRGVSVVVPVYNSEGTLGPLLLGLEAALTEQGLPFEVILVNDASADRSWPVVVAASKRHAFVRGVNMMRNFGQQNATLCGVRRAKFDTIVTMDDDLQHPPEEIPKLLARLDEGWDVAYGTAHALQHGFLRDMASSVTKLALQRAMGADTAQSVSSFRAFRTILRTAFDQYRAPFVSLDVLLTWGTNRFTRVSVRHEPRTVGVSNYTLGKLILHAVNMITGFSTLPLQIASFLGFFCTLFGLLLFVFVVGKFFWQGGDPPGFPFLASMIAIFSGAQLFTMGVFGEYLARIHFRLLDRPSYAVREQVTGEDPEGLEA